MAKWQDVIGFEIPMETVKGVWTPQITERIYRGDIISNRQSYQSSSSPNDNVAVSMKLSILSNDFVQRHLSEMRYIRYRDTLWRISNIEDFYPRVVLTIGGLYHVENSY